MALMDLNSEEAHQVVKALNRHARLCGIDDCVLCEARDAASRHLVTVTPTLLQRPADAARQALAAHTRPSDHESPLT